MKARGATTSGVSVSKEVSGKSPESDFCWLGKLEILDIGAFETLGYVRGGKNGNGERHLSLSKMGCCSITDFSLSTSLYSLSFLHSLCYAIAHAML